MMMVWDDVYQADGDSRPAELFDGLYLDAFVVHGDVMNRGAQLLKGTVSAGATAVIRLIPNSCASSRVPGSRRPRRSLPRRMLLTMASVICS